MASLMCVKCPGGNVSVQNDDVLEELVIDAEDNIYTEYVSKSKYGSRSMRRPQSTPHNRQRTALKSMDTDALIGHTLRLQAWLNEKSVKSIQDKADTDVQETKKMYDSVLETEDTFVKDVEAIVDDQDEVNLRRRELLHKKWNEQVFTPITKQIQTEIDGPNYGELSRCKRGLHRDYLEHVNRKGHVFLDTIAPDEYYPMSLHPARCSLLTAQTRHLRDPLLSQGRERSEEDRIIIRCGTGSTLTDRDIECVRLPPLPLVPLGRHGTECSTWTEMPMGDIESPVRQASRRKIRPNFNKHNFEMSSKANEPFDPEVIDEEFQIQKKRMFPQEPTFVFRNRSKVKCKDASVQAGQ